MTKYIVQDPDNLEERQCVASLDQYEDWNVLATLEGELPEFHDVVDGEVIPILASFKEQKWNQVKTLRTLKENDYCNTPVGPVQIDETSKAKIMGVLDTCKLCEELSIPFSESFTLWDNSVAVLNNTTVRQMALTVSKYISDVYARGRNLRVLIENASTMEELEAIDINADWPDPSE
jgi:hypothetical protein